MRHDIWQLELMVLLKRVFGDGGATNPARVAIVYAAEEPKASAKAPFALAAHDFDILLCCL